MPPPQKKPTKTKQTKKKTEKRRKNSLKKTHLIHFLICNELGHNLHNHISSKILRNIILVCFITNQLETLF